MVGLLLCYLGLQYPIWTRHNSDIDSVYDSNSGVTAMKYDTNNQEAVIK